MHITVAIPVYNRANLVKRTIESVIHQTHNDYDLLIVDDASTDDTISVISGLALLYPQIHIEKNIKNLGLTRNWNRCLTLADGPLIQILLSDDLLDPDYLGLVSDIFTNYESVGMVACSCRYIDANDNMIHPGNPKIPRLYKRGDEAVSALLVEGFPHVSSIVVRKKCYEELGLFNEKIWHGPDVEMDTRIASKYDFYHFGSIHTSFRRHGSNMGNLEYMRDDFLDVDALKKRMAWGHLSPRGQSLLGIKDLELFIKKDAAQVSLTGVNVMLAIGKFHKARYYFGNAIKNDWEIIFLLKYWKSLFLILIPPLGKRIMQHRMGIKQEDANSIKLVQQSLNQLPNNNEL